MKDGVQNGTGASESVGSACSGNCSHRKIKLVRQMAAAAAAGKKRSKELSTIATQTLGRRSLDW